MVAEKNQTKEGVASGQDVIAEKNQTRDGAGFTLKGQDAKNETNNLTGGGPPTAVILAPPPKNQTSVGTQVVAAPPPPSTTKMNATASGGIPQKAGLVDAARVSNLSVSLSEGAVSVVGVAAAAGRKSKQGHSVEHQIDGGLRHIPWEMGEGRVLSSVQGGILPQIDESFNCYHNGRPDHAYQKLRWQPNGCIIPGRVTGASISPLKVTRSGFAELLNGTDMLERLRGRRLVFVGDSLNRNMWESLVCILRNSIEDKSRVSKRPGSTSLGPRDYNCSVEFFRSPFLVQEWEAPDSAGKKKETLRLDIIEKSSSRYKDADIIIFNTGHWWTHEKTSKGKDYYQEGNRVYGELKVIEAFHKALSTWARWVDTNVDPVRSLVFFRGYSASHFSGGRWNSGGQCHSETEPIKNETYLSSYPPKMSVLEMTDYRKDGHPSVYRRHRFAAPERQAPDHFQDCSHWCLPGVPDSWNELLYAQLLLKLHQRRA
ncbi:unnamed protein product [Spirodela intermedia]|uniref:Uncharacterized protein n=1 Tax=Spirodela intermedia TaxID=51605 RepID=A0A7I8J3B9_SPIIN|nr:unnamed protein product [Spirodela intermedia]CAA6664707.1 unnamed protein product [Spirodela intermedia]